MKLNVCVRAITPDDISSIRQVESQCFKEPWPEGSYERELENKVSLFLGAWETDGAEPPMETRLAGYIGAWIIVDEAHINMVAVDPFYRGQGVGKLLVWMLLKAAMDRQCRWATLEVSSKNSAARGLYESFNFKSLGEREGYYNKDEDALIMWTENMYKRAFQEKMNQLRKEWEEKLCLSSE